MQLGTWPQLRTTLVAGGALLLGQGETKLEEEQAAWRMGLNTMAETEPSKTGTSTPSTQVRQGKNILNSDPKSYPQSKLRVRMAQHGQHMTLCDLPRPW